MTTPAGWFPAEPERPGEQRYWDGTQWTSAYRPALTQARRRKPPSRVWAWLGVLGVAITLAGLGLEHLDRSSPSSADTSQIGAQYGLPDSLPTATDDTSVAPEPTATQPDITAAEANKLQDKGWVLISYEPVMDDSGDLSISARIRNANLDTQTGVFTITLLRGQATINTYQASADDVAAGQTVSVTFISEGNATAEQETHLTSVEFQTDETVSTS